MAETNETSSTLAEWLLACIKEEKVRARTAHQSDHAPWAEIGQVELGIYGVGIAKTREVYGRIEPESLFAADGGFAAAGTSETAAAHVATWDPARVLAECEAKQAIVELHTSERGDPCPVCCASGYVDGYGLLDWEEAPCRTIRLLALPYADRPGYREEWRA